MNEKSFFVSWMQLERNGYMPAVLSSLKYEVNISLYQPIILLVSIILVVCLIVIVVVVIFSIVTVIVINFECVVLQKAPRRWVKSKFFLRNKKLLSTSCHKHTCGWLSLNSNILISGRYRPLKPEITDVVVWILLIDFLGCNLGLGRKKISNCKSANFRKSLHFGKDLTNIKTWEL